MNTVRSWENGEVVPRADALAALATATGKPIEFFFDEEGDDGDEKED